VPDLIVMTITVRDEADIIAHNIAYHRRMGVDRFLVIDHRSVDGTGELLKRFAKLGFVTVIRKDEEIYRVKEWTNGLIRNARKQYAPTWIIPNDSDEFHVPPEGHTVKSYLATCLAHRVLKVERTNVIFGQEELAAKGWRAAQGYASTVSDLFDVAIADPAVEMKLPWLYSATLGKVTFQPATFKSINKGSHRVVLEPPVEPVASAMRILHFAARSRDEVVRAAIRLGNSAELIDKADIISPHYRRWVRMVKAGAPEDAIYDENLPRQERLNRDVASGVLVPITYPEALREVLMMDADMLLPAPPQRSLWARVRGRAARVLQK
jgi:Glycosyl transferase family 2